MIEIRPFNTLGTHTIDWLKAHYHFSFSEYRDPNRMNWGALRVWNDDTIKPGTGFARHGHRDMEIITYVRKGAITHRDHLGNEGRTLAGDVQVMSAGKGILHEEHNLEPGETQIFQLWIVPNQIGVEPHWDAKRFPKADRSGQLVTLASGDGRDGSLIIHQDAQVLGATLKAGESVQYTLAPGRFGYLVPALGAVTLNGHAVRARDGAAFKETGTVTLQATEDSEIILVDAPPLAA